MKTVVIISGYFNPIHIGHISMMKAAKEIGDYLVVIVNNDKQQILKKGKIIMSEDERAQVVSAIRYVDDVVISIDETRDVCKTLEKVIERYKGDRLILGNGGDRSSAGEVPETVVCEKNNIEMIFDLGGNEKMNSSSNINKLTGAE